MALCNSGSMSLGGSTTGRSVNCELGRSGTSSINMNDSEVRNLAGRSSGSICMSNFYGKSAGPSSLGQVFEGGYYMGTISAAGSGYFLLMSPNATGFQSSCRWRNYPRLCSGVGLERCDGFGNTYDHLDNSCHPAGNWAATRSINGFSDWYLPAICELGQLQSNCGSAPSGQEICPANHWSSTEIDSSFACRMCMQTGVTTNSQKGGSNCVRAIRREPF